MIDFVKKEIGKKSTIFYFLYFFYYLYKLIWSKNKCFWLYCLLINEIKGIWNSFYNEIKTLSRYSKLFSNFNINENLKYYYNKEKLLKKCFIKLLFLFCYRHILLYISKYWTHHISMNNHFKSEIQAVYDKLFFHIVYKIYNFEK